MKFPRELKRLFNQVSIGMHLQEIDSVPLDVGQRISHIKSVSSVQMFAEEPIMVTSPTHLTKQTGSDAINILDLDITVELLLNIPIICIFYIKK